MVHGRLTCSRFLALGGAIGTGLFIGSGAILNTVGPAPLFMAYLSMMLLGQSRLPRAAGDDHTDNMLSQFGM